MEIVTYKTKLTDFSVCLYATHEANCENEICSVSSGTVKK